MKTTRSIFAMLLIVVLAASVTSCQLFQKPLTAQEVMTEITNRAANLKSGEFKMVVDLKVQGMGISIDLDGKFKAPEEAYVKLNLMGQNVEFYMRDKQTAYTRQAPQTRWTKMDAAQLKQAGALGSLSSNPVDQQRDMMKYYEDLTLLAEEKQDGVDCYHLGFKVDLEKVLGQVLDADMLKTLLAGANGEIKFTNKMNGELWVGKADFLPRRMGLTMEMEASGQKLSIKLGMDYTKLNQPVEMPQVDATGT
jgi:hypothetical protein